MDISELKEEDKVSRVLTGLQIVLSLEIETTETKRQKQGQFAISTHYFVIFHFYFPCAIFPPLGKLLCLVPKRKMSST